MLAMVSLLLVTAAPARSPIRSQHWVGSWLASPSDASTFRGSLTDQTLRMIVAPHLGGVHVRVHLSNLFGTVPIRLGPVTVAVRGYGAAVSVSTLRRLSFSGAETVTIPAGGSVLSDAVVLRVQSFQALAVSVAVPGTITGPTEHFSTRQTSYLSPPGTGDHAMDRSGAAFSQTSSIAGYSTGWYFLSGIDVQASRRVGSVVAFGDSITDGYQGNHATGTEQLRTIDVNGRWPDDLQRRLDSVRIPLSVLNAGISGNRVLSPGLISVFGPSGLSRFRRDALSVAGVRDVVVLEGINDIGENAQLTPGRLIAGYQRLIAMAHDAGVRIQLGTLTPAEGASQLNYGSEAANATRQAVNRWIRTQRLSDGVIDFDAAVRDPRHLGHIRPSYDGSDHLHFDLSGYRAMARAINLKLLARGR